jgi:hypothetical protein
MDEAFSSQMVRFTRTRSGHFLEAAGISSEVRGELLRNTHGLTLDGLGMVEIVVNEVDEERARALLASAEAGESRLDDDAQTSSS